jgi:hypothetical protein
MLFLNNHQKSVFSIETANIIRPLLEVHSDKICEVRFGCFSFIFLTMVYYIEQNTSFHSTTLIMIICPFSSSHFATQIFPIDELLKPYN